MAQETPTLPSASTPPPPSNLQQALNGLQQAQMIVGALGIAGFMFAVKTELSSEERVEVTENWVQDGAFVNDHTAIPPATIKLSGRVSENEYRKHIAAQVIAGTAQAIGMVAAFAPTLTNTVRFLRKTTNKRNQAINATNKISNIYTNSFNIYGSLQQLLSFASNQGRVYAFFRALQHSRTLVSVITPWAFYPSMLITNLSSTSPQESNTWCDIELELKEWRAYTFAQETALYVPPKTEEGLKNTMAQPVNQGQNNGTQPRISVYGRIIRGGLDDLLPQLKFKR